MTQIIRCRVENILGAKLVDIKPNGQPVTIGGANGEGKSSAIRALCMALGGKDEIPPEPVFQGAERGVVIVELEEFIVRLVVTKDRKSELVIENRDGASYSRPQSMLDKLFGGLSFNPGLFKTMDKAKRLATLKQILKLDFTALDCEYENAYSARRDAGRDVKELTGKLAGRTLQDGVPEKEINIQERLETLRILQAENRRLDDLKVKAAALQRDEVGIAEHNKKLFGYIQELENKIAEAKKAISDNEFARKVKIDAAHALQEEHDKAIKANDTLAAAVKVHDEIGNAETVNRKVRENEEVLKLRSALAAKQAEQVIMEAKITSVEAEKKRMIAAAPMPIENLGFAADGVTYRNLPFEQLSESEQWEISTAIGFALNPKGVLFMANSGGLDKTSRDRIRERAKVLGVQLFLEVVDDAQDVNVVIEEGTVKENRL